MWNIYYSYQRTVQILFIKIHFGLQSIFFLDSLFLLVQSSGFHFIWVKLFLMMLSKNKNNPKIHFSSIIEPLYKAYLFLNLYVCALCKQDFIFTFLPQFSSLCSVTYEPFYSRKISQLFLSVLHFSSQIPLFPLSLQTFLEHNLGRLKQTQRTNLV